MPARASCPQSPEPSGQQHSPEGTVQQARRRGHSLRRDNGIPGHVCSCSHPSSRDASDSVESPCEKEAWEPHPSSTDLSIRAATCPEEQRPPHPPPRPGPGGTGGCGEAGAGLPAQQSPGPDSGMRLPEEPVGSRTREVRRTTRPRARRRAPRRHSSLTTCPPRGQPSCGVPAKQPKGPRERNRHTCV